MTIQSFSPSPAPTLSSPHEYLLLRCDVHGTKVTRDFDSARLYVSLMLDCQRDQDDPDHWQWHAAEGTDCWVDGGCCTVDPYGMFD
jgi:hypothetical protein